MAILALVLYGVWFLLVFVLRTLLQVRRTGDTGLRASGLSGRRGSIEWWAGMLFFVAFAAGLAAPIADLAGMPLLYDTGPLRAGGAALGCLGVAGTFSAQVSMGRQWRIGVDTDEQTDLVTTGVFALVRNPVFSGIGVTALGLVLMIPNWIAFAAFAALVISIEIQVRAVEEPHLFRLHGADYVAYAARVGRFLPGVGRLQVVGSGV